MAEQQGVSVRTIERRLANGEYDGLGFYRKRGRWYLRRLPPDEVEIVIRLQIDTILHYIRVQSPWLNDLLDYAHVKAAGQGDVSFTVIPSKLNEPCVQLLLKASMLRLSGCAVTRESLAALMRISRSTFDRRYKNEGKLLREICRPLRTIPQIWEILDEEQKNTATKRQPMVDHWAK
jgi:hypothetical protein